MTPKKLDQFPITMAFIAEAATRIKGGDTAFWLKKLGQYEIDGKCECGECYTFYLYSDVEKDSFGQDGIFGHFGTGEETIVILHDDDAGRLIEVELPVQTDIPFATEYEQLNSDAYVSAISMEEAQEKVRNWFNRHQKKQPNILVLD